MHCNSQRPTVPAPHFDPMAAYREAALRNALRGPARGPVFQGCERPTVPAPALAETRPTVPAPARAPLRSTVPAPTLQVAASVAGVLWPLALALTAAL